MNPRRKREDFFITMTKENKTDAQKAQLDTANRDRKAQLMQEMSLLAKMQCTDKEILATLHLNTQIPYKELEAFLEENRNVQEHLKYARLTGIAEVKRKLYIKGVLHEDVGALNVLDVNQGYMSS